MYTLRRFAKRNHALHSTLRNPKSTVHLNPVALGHSQDFCDSRGSFHYFEPSVLPQGPHAVVESGLADVPAASPVVGQLADGIGGRAQLEYALASGEAKLTTLAAADSVIQWLVSSLERCPREVLGQFVLFRTVRLATRGT